MNYILYNSLKGQHSNCMDHVYRKVWSDRQNVAVTDSSEDQLSNLWTTFTEILVLRTGHEQFGGPKV